MIRRSTLVLFTCLGASSALAAPSEGLTQTSVAASAPTFIAQVDPLVVDEGSASNVLSIGSRGPAVRALQNRLSETGYYEGDVDGIYGLGTQRAVLAFQEDQELDPTGRLDDETWEALEAYEEPSAAEVSSDDVAVPVDTPIEETESELPLAVESEPIATPDEASGGGFGRVLGTVITLAAIAASFGIGFFIANRSKLDAAEGDSDDAWGEADTQLGVPSSATDAGTSTSGGLQTGEAQAGSINGFAASSTGTSPASLASVPTAMGAGGLTTSGQIGGTSALAQTDVIDGLIKDLHNPDPSQRRKVIWELGQRGNSIAVQPLVDAMVSADSKEKSLVLAALSEIGIRSLKPMNRALAIALKDDNPEVRKNAIRDLTRIYDLVIQISQMLGHATEDEDPEVRQTATWALDQLNRLRRTQDIDSNMRSFGSGSGPNRFAS